MRIGIITAMAEEMLPICATLGSVVAQDVISGVELRQIEIERHTVYLATSGIGEIRAALAVQLLADLFDVEAILNFGFVGAIDPALKVGELVVVDRAVHYQFDITAVNATERGRYDGRDGIWFCTDKDMNDKIIAALDFSPRRVAAASGDVFVADAGFKSGLSSAFGADICEMEIAGICLAAERNRIPVFSMKVVSDNADESATVSFAEVLEKGLSNYERSLPRILKALSDEKEGALPPATVKP